MEFIQQPELKRIIMMYEGSGNFNTWQIVNMDGRPHPPEVYETPTWKGHAIGRWEGDTLVVDSVGFNEGHWIDRDGSPRTHLHHQIERFTRLDYYTLEHEATVDDPGAYTRPWTIKHLIQFDPDGLLKERVCENNLYLEYLVGITPEGRR